MSTHQPYQRNEALYEEYARLAQSVEHQTFNLRVAGSSPSSGSITLLNFEHKKRHGFCCLGSIIACPSKICCDYLIFNGGLAQMVERSLSMREVPGSMPGSSKLYYFLYIFYQVLK